MSTIARHAVKVDRISEKLHRKASKLGNRETVKLRQSRGATTVKELILKEAKNVPPGEVRPARFIQDKVSAACLLPHLGSLAWRLRTLVEAFSALNLRLVLFLPFHSPVLEPYLYLALCETESMSNFNPSPSRQVPVEVEFLLQL